MPTAIRNFVADRDRGPVVATVAEGCASDDGAASPCVDEATRAHRKTSTQRHPENTLRARRSCHFPRTTRAVERNARMPWWPRTVSSSARDRRMVPGTGDGLGAARLRRAPHSRRSFPILPREPMRPRRVARPGSPTPLAGTPGTRSGTETGVAEFRTRAGAELQSSSFSINSA